MSFDAIPEQYESAAERWYDEHVSGETMTCYCGKKCDINDSVPMSANPYAPPACPDCAERDFIGRLKHDGWRIVRSAKRKRALRKRGINCWWVPFCNCWIWSSRLCIAAGYRMTASNTVTCPPR